MQQMVTIFLPSSKVQMIYLVGVYFAYLPILVMIISVPISWNRFHKSSFSNETLMLGSGLALAVPLVAALDTAVGPMLCIIESNPRWGPNGNPERKLSHFRKWIFNPWRVRSEFDEHHREFRIELKISRVISRNFCQKIIRNSSSQQNHFKSLFFYLTFSYSLTQYTIFRDLLWRFISNCNFSVFETFDPISFMKFLPVNVNA